MDIPNLTQEIAELHAKLCFALADPTRLILLYMLVEHPGSVSELTQKLGISQPNVSRQLKVLRDGGLVIARRQGTSILYTLTDHRIIEALDLLRAVLRDRIHHDADLMDELHPS